MVVQMLRVTGWGSNSYWYAGKAGEVFRLLGTDFAAGEYITREPSGYVNIIKFADAELVDVVPTVPTAPESDAVCATAPGRIESKYQIVIEVSGDNLQGLSPGEWRDVARRGSDHLCRFLEGKDIGLRSIRPV